MGRHSKPPEVDEVLAVLRKEPVAVTDAETAGVASMNLVEPWESLLVYRLLEKLACVEPVCVGYVNSTGWHLDCQRRAREAMELLEIPLPPEDAWKEPHLWTSTA